MADQHSGLSERIYRYQLEVSLAELELTRSTQAAQSLPDIDRLLASPAFRSAAIRLQELIWTVRRLVQSKTTRRRLDVCATAVTADNRILFDLTAYHMGITTGGIRRLSQKLAEQAEASGLVTLTAIEDGVLKQIIGTTSVDPVDLARGDTFVIVCFFWTPFDEYRKLAMRCKEVGARLVVFVHDITPALYPGFMNGIFHRNFKSMLAYFILSADVIITLSRSSASEIEEYAKSRLQCDRLPLIRWFHMGSDATRETNSKGAGRAEGLSKRPTFLSVGTLLPHKGVPIAISAFDILWAKEIDVDYIVVGADSGEWESIPQRIRSHPQYGHRLHWVQNCSDGELSRYYRAAYCYIQPSINEGFGIPIVEAASYNKPIIASDIPVFREIGSADIAFFPCCDAAGLAEAIVSSLSKPPIAPTVNLLSWKQSFQRCCKS